jgi:hypothetical protein
MKTKIRKFAKHACQFCGCERKYIETIIDDEFVWNEKEKMYQPYGFTDAFEHTGVVSCAECKQPWTGM